MNRLPYLLFMLLGMAFAIISCSDDDDEAPSPNPTITVTPGAAGAAPGETVDFTIAVNTVVTNVTANDGSGAVAVNGGTFSYVVDAGTGVGTVITLTFVATDNLGNQATTTATITVGKGEVDVTDPNVTDATFEANTIYNLDASVEYLFDGLVYIEEGSVLNIPAGTVIKFKKDPTSSDATSSLIITRGAQIFANGTSDDPIIMTAEDDDLAGLLGPGENQQWAGLIVLGRAPAFKDGATEIQIEGIDSGEPRGLYGGTDPLDDSGELRYVSIRYTGFALNGVAGDEIQGLTLGGVGSGTVIDYIDIYSSADDGVEIFGGTVDIRHISVAFSTDDDFDFDLGWRGTGQFLFALMGDETVGFDHSGEWDGADPDDADLFSAPNIYNATFIGPGTGAAGRDKAILMRENFAGKLGNSILEDYPGVGIEVQDNGDGTGSLPNDSYERLTVERDGYIIEITNNTWANFAGATDLNSLIKPTSGDDGYVGQTEDTEAELADNNNKYSAAGVLTSISRTPNGGLDPRPLAEDTEVATVPDGLEQVDYRGAFSASDNWLSGWSTLSKFGFMPQ